MLYLREIIKQMKFITFLFIHIVFVAQINAQEVTPAAPTNSNSTIQFEEREEVEQELEISSPQPKAATKIKLKSEKKVVTQTEKVQQYSKAIRTFNLVETKSNQNTLQRNPTVKEQQVLDHSLKQMEESEYLGVDFYLAHYKVGNYDMSKLHYLEKAYSLNPEDKEIIKHLVGAYFILENTEKLDKKIGEMSSGNIFETDYYAYANDVVVGLMKNATLISHGDKDTYPLIKVLREQNRRDVTLINLDFLQSKDYRSNLSKKGYVLPHQDVINADYLSAFCNLNSAKNIQIAYSVPKNYVQNMVSSLYVRGLTFEFTKSKKDVFAQNLSFFNYVKNSPLLRSQSPLSNQLKSNYMPSLLILKKGYVKENNTVKVIEIEAFLKQIAEKSNKKEELNKADVE